MATRSLMLTPDFTVDDIPEDMTDEQVRQIAIDRGELPTVDSSDGYNNGYYKQYYQGAHKFLAERSQGLMDNSQPTPDTVAGYLGYLTPPLLVSALTGPRALAQGLASAGLEMMREGATPTSAAINGILSGAFTGAFNTVARVIRGGMTQRAAKKAVDSGLDAPPLTVENETPMEDLMGRMASTANGFSAANYVNIMLINKSLQRAMGIKNPSPKVKATEFETARKGIQEKYQDAIPTMNVNVSKIAELLEKMPKEVGPQVNNILKAWATNPERNIITPHGWQTAHRELRKFRPSLFKGQYSAWTDTLDEALNMMDDVAAQAGGDAEALAVANQQFKVLSIAEGIDKLVATGDVPPGQLFRGLGVTGWYGFGKKATAEGDTTRLLPETVNLIELSKTLTEQSYKLAGGSATAGRYSVFGPPAAAAFGFLSGTLDPQQALMTASVGLLPSAAALALLTKKSGSTVGGMLGSGAGTALSVEAERDDIPGP